ncbi:hypothetical protein CMV_019297 [Castanea mollissima]|uniref:RNase H type-1 domain-containing protein n=1 Tax=Castanea mollissima TaxID=60419 RepID=A0A8J4QK13_9ROSI|nr:hypothetical protein CMV_019297 [Castanea mollissima]
MDQDSGVNECEQSVKTNLMSIEGEDKMISSAYSDHGPCLEVVSASITNYPLRRIDPKLRPGNMGVMGFTTSVAAELWALRDGIRLCISRKLPIVIVELDAQLFVDLLKKDDGQPNSFDALLSDCKVGL